MTPNDYIKLATRTEAIIPTVKANRAQLLATMQSFIAVGQLLDQFKKHIYYGKEFKTEEAADLLQMAANNIAFLQNNEDGLDGDETSIEELDTRVFHAIIGMATETVEMMEVMESVMTGQGNDAVNLAEESFDVDWYQFILADVMNLDIEQKWNTGFDKLRKRFPQKFTQEEAINRDTDSERKILEDGMGVE